MNLFVNVYVKINSIIFLYYWLFYSFLAGYIDHSMSTHSLSSIDSNATQ
jgi:hypothetical protein